MERGAPQIALAYANQIKKHDRCRDLMSQETHPRCSRMKTELQSLEGQSPVSCNDNFAVKNTSAGQLRLESFDDLREITGQRFFVAALDQNFFSVAKYQRTEAVPLRFEDPCSIGG